MTSYPTIVPYLAVADAAAALDFYKRAFGAEERIRVPGPDRAVMHAEILVNGGLVMLTDGAPHVGFPAPAPGDTVPVGIMVAWPTSADVDAIHARAVAAGASSEIEPRDEPWGAVRGRDGPLRPALVAARALGAGLSLRPPGRACHPRPERVSAEGKGIQHGNGAAKQRRMDHHRASLTRQHRWRWIPFPCALTGSGRG